jgi:hypothetical protein
MAVVVTHGAAVPVGPALGAERRVDRGQIGSQLAQHRLDHVVTSDHQSVVRYLTGRVTVADMPGEPREGTPNLDQILGRRNHAYGATIVQKQRIAVVKAGRFGQIDHE